MATRGQSTALADHQSRALAWYLTADDARAATLLTAAAPALARSDDAAGAALAVLDAWDGTHAERPGPLWDRLAALDTTDRALAALHLALHLTSWDLAKLSGAPLLRCRAVVTALPEHRDPPPRHATETPPDAPPAPARAARRMPRRLPVLAAALAVVLALGGTAWWLTRTGPEPAAPAASPSAATGLSRGGQTFGPGARPTFTVQGAEFVFADEARLTLSQPTTTGAPTATYTAPAATPVPLTLTAATSVPGVPLYTAPLPGGRRTLLLGYKSSGERAVHLLSPQARAAGLSLADEGRTFGLMQDVFWVVRVPAPFRPDHLSDVFQTHQHLYLMDSNGVTLPSQELSFGEVSATVWRSRERHATLLGCGRTYIVPFSAYRDAPATGVQWVYHPEGDAKDIQSARLCAAFLVPGTARDITVTTAGGVRADPSKVQQVGLEGVSGSVIMVTLRPVTPLTVDLLRTPRGQLDVLSLGWTDQQGTRWTWDRPVADLQPGRTLPRKA